MFLEYFFTAVDQNFDDFQLILMKIHRLARKIHSKNTKKLIIYFLKVFFKRQLQKQKN